MDELSLDEGMLSEEMPMDELSLDEGMLSEEMPMDELSLDEGMLLEEMPMDELSLDEGMLSEEMPMDELSLDEGMLSEEMLMDELSLDEGMLSEEMPMDELSLDEGMLSEEMPMDELSLDEGMLSEEMPMDGLSFDEGLLSDEDSASDDLNLDELGLGDLGLDELGSEETDIADTDMMIQEESDIESEQGDDITLEESGEDDSDLSALLASMGGDEALSEINDLLEKSDQGVSVDDDMLALLDDTSEGGEGGSFDFFANEVTEEGEPEDIRELTPEMLAEGENSESKKQKKEEKERKKREKAAKKAKKNNASQSADAEDMDALGGNPENMDNGEDTPKKKGFFAKFLDLLLEEDDSESAVGDAEAGDVGLVIGNLTDENKELLDELSAEDKKNAKKKDKKAKKTKKNKKKADVAAEDGEEGGEETEEKSQKPKKVKKPKKEKKVEEEPKVPEKKLSKKKVTSIFLFCATIAACIVVVTMLLPQQMEKQEARVAFDNNQYDQVYELLYGKKLSEEDEVLFHKSSLVLQMQRKLDSYDNYVKMGMQLEALNALVEGVDRYRNLREDAEMYNVGGEIASIYGQILARLSDNYGLSESDTLDIISSEDDVTYSQRLQSIISGENYGEEEETQPMKKQDVLPEEEEIIDRLQGTETE